MHSMRSLSIRLTIALAFVEIIPDQGVAGAAELDLNRAVIVVPDGLSGPENKAVQFLVEEVRARRTSTGRCRYGCHTAPSR